MAVFLESEKFQSNIKANCQALTLSVCINTLLFFSFVGESYFLNFYYNDFAGAVWNWAVEQWAEQPVREESTRYRPAVDKPPGMTQIIDNREEKNMIESNWDVKTSRL